MAGLLEPTLPLGLYVHLPWCTRKCPYCDFNSHEAADIPERSYISVLLADLDLDRAHIADRAVESIFIGGGIAPKILPALETGAFMQAFTAKGRFSELLSAMPVRVALEPRVPLLGAARHALSL